MNATEVRWEEDNNTTFFYSEALKRASEVPKNTTSVSYVVIVRNNVYNAKNL